MTRSSVDLPQPEGPISEMNSPRPTSRSMSWSAVTPPLPNVFVTPCGRDDDRVRRAHTSCSGARRTTSFSTSTTTRKNEMPSSAAIRFVAQRFSGSSDVVLVEVDDRAAEAVLDRGRAARR